MKLLAIVLSAFFVMGCATSKGNVRAAQHSADQIRMVQVQRDAILQEKHAQAQLQVALVEALARVAEANPEHAPSTAVALAVIGVRGASTESQDSPVVTLQREQNVGLEYVKALAPTVGTLVSGLGVAAINASVTKNAQNANKEIQINDQQSDVAIVQAVAGLGTAASNNSGITAGGDVYQMQDQALVDNGDYTDSSTDNSDYEQNYAQDDAFINNGENIHDSAVSFAGQDLTLGDLIAYLTDQGSPFSLIMNGQVVASSTSGTGETVVIDCNKPLFSPRPPQCT
jgi:sulfur carrier protein ThiS